MDFLRVHLASEIIFFPLVTKLEVYPAPAGFIQLRGTW